MKFFSGVTYKTEYFMFANIAVICYLKVSFNNQIIVVFGVLFTVKVSQNKNAKLKIWWFRGSSLRFLYQSLRQDFDIVLKLEHFDAKPPDNIVKISHLVY